MTRSIIRPYMYNQASHQVELSDPGKLIMWTRICDGLKKTLGLSRKQL